MIKRPPVWRTEIVAGITTFFTMSYIIFVNPSILATPGTGMPFSGVLTATVMLSCLMCLMMGFYANLPFAVAPGMGINAFFTYSLILGQKIPWQTALGMVFWAGILFVAISVTPIRETIARAIPENLRIAASAGIGLFLTFIGLKNAGLVAADPVTFVKLGTLNSQSSLSVLGIFVAVFYLRKKSPFAFLISIFSCTLVALFFGWVSWPEHLFAYPDFSSVFFKVDVWGALKFALLPAILSVMFTDLFDSISTFVGVSHAASLVDKQGNPKNLREGLIVDAFATFCAGLFGSSSGTAYIESSAGIEVGGRTGWTAIFTGLCFVPFLFIAPLAGIIPANATAPVLILVGAMMFRTVRLLPVDKLEETVPAFITLVMIPLTFSITQGILWGFLFHSILFVLAGRAREVTKTMYALSALSASLIWLEYGAK